jgi:hypothetical protein
MSNLQLQKDFLKAIQEIYTEMFTSEIYLYLMDTANTAVNQVYKETVIKRYQYPINLVGRVKLNPDHSEIPVEAINIDAMITIPTKELDDKKVSHTPEYLEDLKKAKFEYKGVGYLIDTIYPMTNLADEYLTFNFLCKKEKNKSVR